MTRKEIEEMSTEGLSGIKNLSRLAISLGYDEFSCNDSIIRMLEDNPCMVAAIYDVVLNSAE